MLKNVQETAAWERSRGEFSVIEVPAVIVSIETFVSLQKDAEKILGFGCIRAFIRSRQESWSAVDKPLRPGMGFKK